MNDFRYPIGQFAYPETVSTTERATFIEQIERFPTDLRATVEPLTDPQLDTPYRPGGWTIRRLVHHIGDSHANALTRFKWTLTEDHPTIKTYDEKGWAELTDSTLPVNISLQEIDALHARWSHLNRQLPEAAWARLLFHPGAGRDVRLDQLLAQYAWHGRHHLAHIQRAKF